MSLHKRDLQDEILHRTGYTPCPNELFEALKGEPIAFVVWMYIFKQCETWNPSYTKMTVDLGMSRNAVIRAVKILEELNLLVVHSGGQLNGANETNKYELSPIKNWKLAGLSSPPTNEGGVVQNMNYPAPHKDGGRGALKGLGGSALKGLELRQIEKDKEDGEEDFQIQEKPTPEKVTVAVPILETKAPLGVAYNITSATGDVTLPKVTKPTPETTVAEKPTTREIIRSWKRAMPDRPSFESRRSLLEDLFATLKKFSYREEDLHRSFKDEALSAWISSKSKEYAIKASNEDYEIALSILSPEIQIVSATPVKNKMKIKNDSNHEMDVDFALENMITDDDEIQRMIEEHQKLLRGEDNE
jgi:hypothetical protein